MTRTPSTLEIVWGIHLLLVVIILFRPTVPILDESQFHMPLFVQSEPISPFVRHCMGVGLYEEVPALDFTSTTRAQTIWCSTKCHSACIYPCPPPTPRARSEIMSVASIQRSRRAVKTRYSWPICHVCTVQFIKFSGDWNFLEHMIGGLYRKNRKSTAKAFQCE